MVTEYKVLYHHKKQRGVVEEPFWDLAIQAHLVTALVRNSLALNRQKANRNKQVLLEFFS